MEEMLHALNDGGSAGFFGKHSPGFHPRQIRSEILGDPIEQELERFTGQRLLADQDEVPDAPLAKMPIMIVVVIVARVVAPLRGARGIGLLRSGFDSVAGVNDSASPRTERG